jgi:hypothetical protein
MHGADHVHAAHDEAYDSARLFSRLDDRITLATQMTDIQQLAAGDPGRSPAR